MQCRLRVDSQGTATAQATRIRIHSGVISQTQASSSGQQLRQWQVQSSGDGDGRRHLRCTNADIARAISGRQMHIRRPLQCKFGHDEQLAIAHPSVIPEGGEDTPIIWQAHIYHDEGYGKIIGWWTNNCLAYRYIGNYCEITYLETEDTVYISSSRSHLIAIDNSTTRQKSRKETFWE